MDDQSNMAPEGAVNLPSKPPYTKRVVAMVAAVILLLAGGGVWLYAQRSTPTSTVVQDSPLPGGTDGADKETLRGRDSDNDGVRDDVQSFIQLSNFNEQQKQALTIHANALQTMIMNSGSKSIVVEAASKRRKASACWDFLNPSDNRVTLTLLETRVANTPERLKEYFNSQKNLTGQLLTPPEATAEACQA
jgi:hypothetical protein